MGYRYNAITGELDLVTGNTIPDDVARQFDTDSGTAIPSGNIINFLGDATQGISSSGSGNTVIYTIDDATESQKGVSELATDAEAIAGSATDVTIVPSSLNAKLGDLTANSIPYGAGSTSAIAWTSALTDGQIVIGATGAPPAAANVISTDGSITITNGPNSIDIEVTSSSAIDFITDSGTAQPAGGELDILGGTNMNTAGATNVVTINLDTTLTGLEQVNVDNLRLDGNTISTTDTNGPIILSPDGSGTVQISYATEHAIPIFGASGAISEVGPLTDGQFVIGATAGAPAAGAITSSGGTITVSLGTNTINLETDGAVSNSFATDSGTATPSSGVLTIAGGTGCATAGAGSTVTINLDSEIPSSFPTDSGTATPSGNALTVAGGTNMNTSGSGATVTINLDGDVLGLTDLTVDNLELNGNTLSSTNTNGNIILDPDGTGNVSITDTADLLCSGDRAQDIGSTTNAWDNLYIDGISWDDGTNILDDYESGTWTPVFDSSGGTLTGVTYSKQAGVYRKVGDQVFIWYDIRLSNKGTGGAGTSNIINLPFAPSAAGTPPAWHGTSTISQQTLGASQTYTTAAAQSTSRIVLIECGSGTTFGNPTWANATNSSIFIGMITYIT